MDSEWHNYLLANTPGWLLASLLAWLAVQELDVAWWTATGAVAVWVLKDLALYPWLRRYYRSDPPERRIVGERGVALSALDPTGYVSVRGERWRAQPCEPGHVVPEGARIRVCDIEGLLLIVEPDPRLPSSW